MNKHLLIVLCVLSILSDSVRAQCEGIKVSKYKSGEVEKQTPVSIPKDSTEVGTNILIIKNEVFLPIEFIFRSGGSKSNYEILFTTLSIK